ncbi:hypothetical protein CYMTET_28525 [Cymbomonas tetramitiformis]|uniref:Uncharacterized protein n=1 Tax=Cymbomonas tetramitiformis TaxID=36881 RepID=A0AAE0FMT2_9CHLO|nr:hypothetical protein CYMTET_28525 [Cymbomonas tetramitiformis]
MEKLALRERDKREIMNRENQKGGKHGTYRLSPGEIEYRQQQNALQQRQQRLIEVRAQEKAKALEQGLAYRQRLQDEKNKHVERLQHEWTTQNQQQVQVLKKQYAVAVKGIGKSHTEAIQTSEDNDFARKLHETEQVVAEQRAKIRHDSAREKELLAREAVKGEQRAADKRRAEVKDQEGKRARHRIVQYDVQMRQQAAHRLAAKRAEPPTLPGTSELPVHATSQLAPDGYKYTHFHEWVERHPPSQESACTRAALAAAEKALEREQTMREAAEADARAADRANAAALRVHMQQMRQSLEEDLEAVAREELGRKKRAIARRDVREVPILAHRKEKNRQEALEEAFRENFRGEDSTLSPESASLDTTLGMSPTETPAPRPPTRQELVAAAMSAGRPAPLLGGGARQAPPSAGGGEAGAQETPKWVAQRGAAHTPAPVTTRPRPQASSQLPR